MTQAKGLELDNIVSVFGPFHSAQKKLVPDSIQEAHMIQKQRGNNPVLRTNFFYTGDTLVYSVQGGVAVLDIGSADLNPVLKDENIEDVVIQLLTMHDYGVKPEDFKPIQIEAGKKYGKVTRIDLSKLSHKKYDFNPEWCYIEFGTERDKKTKTYEGLENSEDRKLAEAVHGNIARYKRTGKHTHDFHNAMKMVNDENTVTRIYFLNPDYVQKVTKEGEIPVARLGRLTNFDDSSNFNAGDRDVCSYLISVRGILRDQK